MLKSPPTRILSRQKPILYLALGIASVLYWFLLGSNAARYHVSPWGGIRLSGPADVVVGNSTEEKKEREAKLKLQFQEEYGKLGQ